MTGTKKLKQHKNINRHATFTFKNKLPEKREN